MKKSLIAAVLAVVILIGALPVAALDTGLEITRQPVSETIPYGEYTRLFITAEANIGNIVGYQWYRSLDGTYDNVIKITEKTNNNLGVYPDECGIFYYFCAAQAKDMSGRVEKEIYSEIAAITVSGIIQNKNIFDDLTCDPLEELTIPYVFKCWGAKSMRMVLYKNDSRSFEGASYVTEASAKADEVSGEYVFMSEEPENTYYYFTVEALDAKGLVITAINSRIFKIRVRGGFDMVSQPRDVQAELGSEVTLSCRAEFTSGSVITYQWFGCADRQATSGAAIEGAVDAALTVPGGSEGSAYYYCEAYSGGLKLMSDVAKVTLSAPAVKAIELDHGELPFTDVSVDYWYYSDLLTAYTNGLINGKSETTYEPDSYMTVAEAVKLAVTMYEILTHSEVVTGNSAVEGGNWYDNYVSRALELGIIAQEYSDYSVAVTRSLYVGIFRAALSDDMLAAINEIADGAIPDVEKTDENAAIYDFYRAGILRGNDEVGTFAPETNIKRSEVAAILTRIMYAESRIAFSLDSGAGDIKAVDGEAEEDTVETDSEG